MTSKTTASIQRVQKLNHVRQEGPNWVLIAGSALLSTLTVSLGCKLKKAFQIRRQDTAHKGLTCASAILAYYFLMMYLILNVLDVHTEYRKSASKKSSGACQLHSSLYHFNQDEEVCCYCLSGVLSWKTLYKFHIDEVSKQRCFFSQVLKFVWSIYGDIAIAKLLILDWCIFL